MCNEYINSNTFRGKNHHHPQHQHLVKETLPHYATLSQEPKHTAFPSSQNTSLVKCKSPPC